MRHQKQTRRFSLAAEPVSAASAAAAVAQNAPGVNDKPQLVALKEHIGLILNSNWFVRNTGVADTRALISELAVQLPVESDSTSPSLQCACARITHTSAPLRLLSNNAWIFPSRIRACTKCSCRLRAASSMRRPMFTLWTTMTSAEVADAPDEAADAMQAHEVDEDADNIDDNQESTIDGVDKQVELYVQPDDQ